MKKKTKRLTLQMWINQQTPQVIAKKLGVNQSAVRQWRRHYCLPQALTMRKIKILTRGRLTYSQMIEGFYQANKR